MPSRVAVSFPVAVVTIPLGILLFMGGALLLGFTRQSPGAVRLLSALPIASAVPAMVIGGLTLSGGLLSVTLGWGNGWPRRPLPYGSHRSVIAATLLAVVGSALAPLIALLATPEARTISVGVFLFATLTLDCALLVLAYMQAVRPGRVTRRLLGLEGGRLVAGFGWGIVGAATLLALAAASGIVMQRLGIEQPQLEALRPFRGLPTPQLLLIVAAGAIVAPIVEELFFRGYVFNAYLSQKGQHTAYVGSALIFAVVHGEVALLIPIFLMGLVLAFLYRRSGTLLAPMVAHMINNGLAFASFLLGAS
jgi:membrane protease YdiL (CAAX protease family)